MDKQYRVAIPQKLRDLVNLDLSKSYALCLEDDGIFYLVESSQLEDQLVLDVINFDTKGRCILPRKVLSRYKVQACADEFIFVQYKRIYISFIE